MEVVTEFMLNVLLTQQLKMAMRSKLTQSLTVHKIGQEFVYFLMAALLLFGIVMDAMAMVREFMANAI
jgi:hypothetical protein